MIKGEFTVKDEDQGASMINRLQAAT